MTDQSPAHEAQDPGTSPERLLALTQSHPELHAQILLHPSCPEPARQWILATNPDARAAYEKHQAGDAVEVTATPEPAGADESALDAESWLAPAEEAAALAELPEADDPAALAGAADADVTPDIVDADVEAEAAGVADAHPAGATSHEWQIADTGEITETSPLRPEPTDELPALEDELVPAPIASPTPVPTPPVSPAPAPAASPVPAPDVDPDATTLLPAVDHAPSEQPRTRTYPAVPSQSAREIYGTSTWGAGYRDPSASSASERPAAASARPMPAASPSEYSYPSSAASASAAGSAAAAGGAAQADAGSGDGPLDAGSAAPSASGQHHAGQPTSAAQAGPSASPIGADTAQRRRVALWAGGGCLALLALLVLGAVLLLGLRGGGDKSVPGVSTGEASPSASSAQPSDASSSAAPSESPSASASPSPTALAKPAPDGARELSTIVSPSGNIQCVLAGDEVGCSIASRDYTAGGQEDCSGASFSIAVADGAAAMDCGRSFATGGTTLDYGTSAVSGDFACTSASDGMTCWSTRTGHGFTVRKASYETF